MRFNEFYDQETDEMIGVKKYHNLTLDRAIDIVAKDMGSEVLGSGAYGTVIQSKDPNVVYKVLESDAGYMRFVRFVQQYPDKHFPKIYKVKNLTNFFRRYGIQNDKFVVVALEKLEPINPKKLGMNVDFIAALLNTHSPNESPDIMPDGNENENHLPASMFLQWLPELKGLWSAGLKLRGLNSESNDYFWDIHSGNIMMRADGTIVITDPLGSHSGFKYQGAIDTARSDREPMIKGPKYSTQPAKAEPDDDPHVRYIKSEIERLETKQAKEGRLGVLDQVSLSELKRILSVRMQDFQ